MEPASYYIMKRKPKTPDPQPNFHPFERISQRVQEDHAVYGVHAAHLSKMDGITAPMLATYIRKLKAHQAECPLCTCPRLYAFGRWCAAKRQIIRARLRL